MRKSILLLAFMGASGISGAAQAQSSIGKGTGLLTGSVGYHTNTNEYTTPGQGNSSATTTETVGVFSLDLAVGGFVADNLALGVQVQHTVTGGSTKSSNSSSTGGPSSTSTLRVGPMVQYYKMLTDQFGLTATVGAGYESDITSHQNVQYINGYPANYYYSPLKATGYYGSIMPGIVFFPVPKFGLTATMGSLGYNRLKVKDSNIVASSFDAGFGFSQLQFGASYYFGRK